MSTIKKTIIPAILIAGVLLAGSFSVMASQPSQNEKHNEIGRAILKQLSYTDDSQILSSLWGPVPQGAVVQSTRGPVFTTPSAGYVLYIDLYPMRNLFHPVQYVFLVEPTQQIITFDSQSPPLNYQDYQRVDTSFSQFFFSQQNRRVPIPTDASPHVNKGGRDSRYAILMNGGYDQYNNHIRYWNDLQSIFMTLKYIYGFENDNIITLCSDGTNPAPDQDNGQSSPLDFDGDGVNDIKYSCVLSNVDYVFTSLAQNFTPSDKLFIFTTDHGSSVSGEQVDENLWNMEVLHDYHFADLLALFPEGCEKIFTLEPCFSGGFLDDAIVPPGPIVGSSACGYWESSWAMPPDYVYDTYVFYWTAAVNGHDAYGNPADADYNQDGQVTMDEAYQFAVDNDISDESPQYGEYPEDAGAAISLWVGSNPPAQPSKPAGPDLGIWHENYSYTSSTTDPDGDQIYYRFDWDDGSHSSWLGPYPSGSPATGYHIWTVLGVYNVTVQAKDVFGATSLKSDPLTVTITDNQPPLVPQISGPHQGVPGTSYLFNFLTTDPQGDNIWYYVDWGDNSTSGWLGPYVSGYTLHIQHSWVDKGNFTIKAKAKDVYGAESDWGYFNIITPLVYVFSFNQVLKQLFERFPHAFPLMRHLLGY
jgi:hypothetical protein